MATVAQHLKNIATSLRARLDSINASLTAKGQTAADTYDDVPALIDAISTGSNVAGVTATADKVLEGSIFVDSTGTEVEGTMPNNGAIAETMDGIDTKSVSIPKGYTDGGTVSLTNDIDNEVTEQADLISQIQTALEGKAAGGGGITPSGTIEITENGTHDVTNYASALVNVASSGGGTTSATYYTGVAIDSTATIWAIPIEDTDGLVAVYGGAQIEAITDCTYTSGTNIITSFFFTMDDAEFYYTRTGGHPIIGQYASYAIKASNATKSITDTGVSINTGSVTYLNTYKAWNILAIYNK